MTKIIEAIVALAIVGSMSVVVIPDVVDIGNSAITELNRIGRGERARQEQIRKVACEAFPNDCPPPVEPWVDAPLIGAEPATTPVPHP